MKVNVFVCTKPFQWLNVENIRKEGASSNILIIIENFPDSATIAGRIKQYFPHWKEIILVKNRLDAFLAIRKFRVDNLYVDSDYGRKSYLYSLVPGKLFVYDEGIGTYSVTTKELSGFLNKMKFFLFKAIGAGTFQGGNWKTRGVIVYNKKLYNIRFGKELKGKEILSFQYPFNEFIRHNIDRICKVFNFYDYAGLTGKRILLYLTFHKLRDDIISYITEHATEYDMVLVKLHPHLAKFGNVAPLQNKGYNLLTNPIMAEVIILKLAANNYVTILHESSSACLNLGKSPNLQVLDFQNPLYAKDFEQYLRTSE
ncbi:hypothetical protein [Filimonas effusa]|uniref:Uncharacterized protein n=1 Tax=Filimonas effusa TaxID=2508721 RepID=A0A4Q1DF66_9BACT|nr:hypothetical protein [Filimonas effusa]RXK87343.1 hypothetical protein ESB13_11360 [Filimonas effusa]